MMKGIAGARPVGGGGATVQDVVQSPEFGQALETAVSNATEDLATTAQLAAVDAKTGWRGAVRRATGNQAMAGGAAQILLGNLSKASPDFSPVQTVANSIIIPEGVSWVRVYMSMRRSTATNPAAAVARQFRGGTLIEDNIGFFGHNSGGAMVGMSSAIAVQPGDEFRMFYVASASNTLALGSSSHDDATWMEVEAIG